MAGSTMIDQTIDLARLASLDPAQPDEARELRIGIAQAAGWTEIEKFEYWTEGDGWAKFVKSWRGFPPGQNPFDHTELPDYLNSLDAATSLPLDEGAWWDIQIYCDGGTTARIPLTVSSLLRLADPPFENAPKPAWAVCKAWLAYQIRTSRTVPDAGREG